MFFGRGLQIAGLCFFVVKAKVISSDKTCKMRTATRIEGRIDSALHCEARRKCKEIGGANADTS